MIFDPNPEPLLLQPRSIAKAGIATLTASVLTSCTPEMVERSIQAMVGTETFWGGTKGFVLGLAALPLTTHGLKPVLASKLEIGLRVGGPLAIGTIFGAACPEAANGLCLAAGFSTLVWSAQELDRRFKKS
ncbi:hypothetical protein MUP65_00205 [Patescibacteria group bacterium]|nr:hypothetical protein [Patescibacteria group bacterium]